MHSWPLAQSDSDGRLPDDLISTVTERLNRHFQFHLRAHEGDDAQNLEVQPLRFCGRVQKEIESSAAVDHFISHLQRVCEFLGELDCFHHRTNDDVRLGAFIFCCKV